MLNDFLQLVQYSGPKRFLTSVGVILVFLAIFLPWLMINQALAFDLKTVDYNQLTQLSQYNAMARQSISLVLIALSCCLSPILAFFGISFATISYWAWFLFGDSEKEKQSSKSEKGAGKSASLPAEPPIYMVVPVKPEKDTGKLPILPKQETQQISASSEIVVAQSPAVIKEGSRSIKANSYALFVQKVKEILSSPNILKSEYSFENDDWFDAILSSQSENPDIVIKTKYILKNDLWEIVKFYRSLVKEWADHNESRKAKAVGIILFPKLSLLSHILVWILNWQRLLIFFKLEVTILLLAEKMLTEKNILGFVQKNFPVNMS